MMTFDVPLLWTTIQEDLRSCRVSLRGELSEVTAPSLDAALDAIFPARPCDVFIDTTGLGFDGAAEHLLARWCAAPAGEPGTFSIRRPAADVTAYGSEIL